MSVTPSRKIDIFWKWLLFGSEQSAPGFKDIINWFLLVHIIIAGLSVKLISGDPYEFAARIIFPASSILIGLSISWTTRASTILSNKQLRDRLFSSSRPVESYVYGFQLAILSIIVMICYSSVMAAKGLDVQIFGSPHDQILSEFFMYLLISIAVRECWGSVNFTNMLTILEFRREIARSDASEKINP